jgi:hypothetical protein
MTRKKRKELWFDPQTHTGWSKDLPQKERLELAVSGHGGDLLAAARGLRALANCTQDKKTRHKAASDATVLFKRYAREK